MLKRFFFATLLLSSLGLKSQDSSSVSDMSQQLWLDFVPHFFISEKLEFHGDGGFRSNVNNNAWSRVFVRPSVRFHYSDYLKFYGGIGFFYDYNKSTYNNFEFRPWQGVYARWPHTRRVLFDHLLRFEERVIWQSKSDEGGSFEFRTRYKLTATLLFCEPCGDQYWSMPLYGEFIWPLNDQDAELYKNNFRMGIGAAYKYSREWTFDLRFIWQQSVATITERENVSDQILQIRAIKLLK